MVVVMKPGTQQRDIEALTSIRVNYTQFDTNLLLLPKTKM